MRGHELTNARYRLGSMTAGELARLLFVNPSTVSRWENADEVVADPLHAELLAALVALSRHPDAAVIGATIYEHIEHAEQPLAPLAYFLDRCLRERVDHG